MHRFFDIDKVTLPITSELHYRLTGLRDEVKRIHKYMVHRSYIPLDGYIIVSSKRSS